MGANPTYNFHRYLTSLSEQMRPQVLAQAGAWEPGVARAGLGKGVERRTEPELGEVPSSPMAV